METIHDTEAPDAALRDLARRALAEDLGRGDVTTDTTVPENAVASGSFVAKGASKTCVSGLAAARAVFEEQDGGACPPGPDVVNDKASRAPSGPSRGRSEM